MRASARILGLNGGGSDGWDLYRRAKAMIAAGEPVLELTIGEHDIRTDPRILDAMDAAARAGHTGYAPVPGSGRLRDAIAARIERMTGVPTTRDNVVVTAGGQAALLAAHIACCEPGDTALTIDPYYATYPGTIRAASCVPRAVPARPEDGFQPRAEAVDAAAEGAKSLLLNTPNNPTGAVYSEATLTGIGEVARARDLWLISDEVYDAQVWQGRHLSPRGLPGLAERTLVIGSLSKSHAMTGSRLGWIVGPEEMVAAIADLSTNTNYGIPGFIQEAGVFALGLGPDFEAEIAAPFARRRALFLEMLRRTQVLRPVPADGAMYVMLDVSGTGRDGEAFANGLLDAERIAVMPGASFGAAAANHVRVALTLPDPAFEEAARRLIAYATGLAA
ncbi:aminotransferase class I/II-fold pyridoxal phosphate-dependent enzyme [Rhodobacterales bacterium HKCCE3408]|nr:aminotransferase class I/II-fold pyridoxal phosphate-dependent enzyme [Rhodobacterales bacterium HKCCE3408]